MFPQPFDTIQVRAKETKNFFRKHQAILLLFVFVLLVNLNSAKVIFAREEEISLDPLLEAQIGQNLSSYFPYDLESGDLEKALVYESEFLEKPLISSPAEPELPPEPKTPAKEFVYTIQSGDTLSGIGAKYNLKVATLKTVNNLTGDALKLGQQIKIPTGDLTASQIAKIQAKKTPKQLAQAESRRVVSRARSDEEFEDGGGGFIRPTEGFVISQSFGRTRYERFHDGIDLESRSGTNIYAAKDGRVAEVVRGWGQGYGNHIVVNHGGGVETLYGHLSKILVGAGETVKAGQLIGIMGSSGWSTGTHLHFKVTKNGVPINPMGVVK